MKAIGIPKEDRTLTEEEVTSWDITKKLYMIARICDFKITGLETGQFIFGKDGKENRDCVIIKLNSGMGWTHSATSDIDKFVTSVCVGLYSKGHQFGFSTRKDEESQENNSKQDTLF